MSFFFQAEDGIRDRNVTGVQTCALPIFQGERITAVGPAASVAIPPGAKVIDLSRASVLPGLIDGHVHLTDATGGLQRQMRSEEHTSELQSRFDLVCRLLLEKKKMTKESK